MIKKYTIRKCACGSWNIFQITRIDWYIKVRNVAHVATFSDVLILLNLNEMDYIANGR